MQQLQNAPPQNERKGHITTQIKLDNDANGNEYNEQRK
jgi:hypothetical protein